MSSQILTVTWVDPIVSPGQSGLATLTVYAQLVDPVTAALGPAISIGSAAAGAQSFVGPAIPSLAVGSSYRLSVRATDVNSLQGLSSALSPVIGPIGAPGIPTALHVTLL